MRVLIVTPTYLEADNIVEFFDARASSRARRRHPRRRRQQPRRHRRPRRASRGGTWTDRGAAAPEEDRPRRRVSGRVHRGPRARLRHRRADRCRPVPRSRRAAGPDPGGRRWRRRRDRLALRTRWRDPQLALAPPRAVEVGKPLHDIAPRDADQRRDLRATASTAPRRSRVSATTRLGPRATDSRSSSRTA